MQLSQQGGSNKNVRVRITRIEPRTIFEDDFTILGDASKIDKSWILKKSQDITTAHRESLVASSETNANSDVVVSVEKEDRSTWDAQEWILQDNPDRFTILPIKHKGMYLIKLLLVDRSLTLI